MKKKYKFLLISVVIVLSIAAGVYSYLKPLAVEVETVSFGAIQDSFTAQGNILPKDSVIMNANTSGEVISVPFQVGMAVHNGDRLVEIDDSVQRRQMEDQVKSLQFQQSALYAQNTTALSETRLRREQLEQQLAAAQHEYDRLFGDDGTAKDLMNIAEISYYTARRNYNEAKDLDDEDDDEVADLELYTLRNQMELAKKDMMVAQSENSETTEQYYQSVISSYEAQLDSLDDLQGNTGSSNNATAQQLQVTISNLQDELNREPPAAPFDAVVWEMLVEAGSFVSKNEPIAKLYKNGEGEMEIEADVLSEDALRLNVGDLATCSLADGTALQAKIRFISPVAQETLSTIGITENRCKIKLTPVGLPQKIGGGHQVDLTFTSVAAQNTLSVPASSVIPMESGSGVYLARDGKAVLTPVVTGVRSGGRVEILSGISEGEQVILDPYDSAVTEGKRISF